MIVMSNSLVQLVLPGLDSLLFETLKDIAHK